jgi:hypothetical protein
LPFAEAQAEQSNPDEVNGDDREIETVQAHVWKQPSRDLNAVAENARSGI